MSAANVEFLTIEGIPVAPGENPQRFTFRCVGYNRGRDPRLPVEHCASLLIANSGHFRLGQRRSLIFAREAVV